MRTILCTLSCAILMACATPRAPVEIVTETRILTPEVRPQARRSDPKPTFTGDTVGGFAIYVAKLEAWGDTGWALHDELNCAILDAEAQAGQDVTRCDQPD